MKQQFTNISAVLFPDTAKGLPYLPKDIHWLEVRADELPEYKPERCVGKSFIYALRSKDSGGKYEGPSNERNQLLLEAAVDYDLIELEAGKDLSEDVLKGIPPEKRMIAWYGPSKSLEELYEIQCRLTKIPAKYYKIIPEASRSGEELAPLQLLKQSGLKNLIAYASGPIGLWSQIVAVCLGSPFVYGNLDNKSGSHFSVAQLIQDYRLPLVYPVQYLCGIVGNPVLGSLSPRLHNNAYLDTNFPGLFVPFHVESFDDFWTYIVQNKALHSLGLNLKGLTTVSPYKEAAFLKVDLNYNRLNQLVGACNIVLLSGDQWEGHTTDFYGVSAGLKKLGSSIINNKIAVIGCGGAGRTIAAGLQIKGGNVVLVNRSIKRGLNTANQFGLEFQPLATFNPAGYKVVVNATPSGKIPVTMPFDPTLLDNNTVVVDMAYNHTETLLMKKCRELGIACISGRQMLVLQVRRQFWMMTGRDMSLELAQKIAGADAQKAIVQQHNYIINRNEYSRKDYDRIC